MNSNELRIGNWYINGNDEPEQATELFRQYVKGMEFVLPWPSVEGVPLTEEWLVRFGFSVNGVKEWYLKSYEFAWLPGSGDWYYMCEGAFASSGMKYVHQLQNLYFDLSGEELTIKESV